jgi:hypothetical protein
MPSTPTIGLDDFDRRLMTQGRGPQDAAITFTNEGFPVSRINLTHATFIAMSCILAGCVSSHSAEQIEKASNPVRAAAVPIFVVPNCQSLGGESRCQWIEPRGFERGAPAPSSVPTVQGIAL